jgi:hypothetical protein
MRRLIHCRNVNLGISAYFGLIRRFHEVLASQKLRSCLENIFNVIILGYKAIWFHDLPSLPTNYRL